MPGRNHTLVNPSLLDEGIAITQAVTEEQADILSPGALRFVAGLARRFRSTRDELLKLRAIRQREIDAGHFPDFLEETAAIRSADWRVAAIPRGLRNRRVELTGPVDRIALVDALTSGASVYTADLEDASSPTWTNCIDAQVNLRDAIDGIIGYEDAGGNYHSINGPNATLFVRPRGWHFDERHMRLDGEPVPASLFDFGLFFFHNAAKLAERRAGPYFYLPKIESHLEARLWNDVFVHAQDTLGIAPGNLRATVLIETVLAAFEMDEILFELRDHALGLNCGRWDYIFSFIKRFRNHAGFVLPDRERITMDAHFLDRYNALLVRTCHRRGAQAVGGASAEIPVENDAAAHERAIRNVRDDKCREIRAGHDGTSVAHPALVPVVRELFDECRRAADPEDAVAGVPEITAEDLLRVPTGAITEDGLRANLRVGIRYLESWLNGRGAIPLYNRMEDAATAEIARAQVWQWIRHESQLEDGRSVSRDMVRAVIVEELSGIARDLGGKAFRAGKFDLASKIFSEMMLRDEFPEFMPLFAYEHLG
jgi:malate synthase